MSYAENVEVSDQGIEGDIFLPSHEFLVVSKGKRDWNSFSGFVTTALQSNGLQLYRVIRKEYSHCVGETRDGIVFEGGGFVNARLLDYDLHNNVFSGCFSYVEDCYFSGNRLINYLLYGARRNLDPSTLILPHLALNRLYTVPSGHSLTAKCSKLGISLFASVDRIVMRCFGLLAKYSGLRGHLTELTPKDVAGYARKNYASKGKPKHPFLKSGESIVLNNLHQKVLATWWAVCAFGCAYLASAVIWKFRKWRVGGLVRVPLFVGLTILTAVFFAHGLIALGVA